jgi:hypothetical protein
MSDKGLAMCDRIKDEKAGAGKTKRVRVWPSIECSCEEDVFSVLGIGYVPPAYRDTKKCPFK